jgi:hypothetical protein
VALQDDLEEAGYEVVGPFAACWTHSHGLRATSLIWRFLTLC